MATKGFQFPPPPTYAEPTIVDNISGKAIFNPIWMKWFLDVAQIFSRLGEQIGTGITHSRLIGLQGGNAGLDEFYHLTATQASGVGAGISGTVILAPLTGGGTPGSLTIMGGSITGKVDPT
jgi:hypothetical protein